MEMDRHPDWDMNKKWGRRRDRRTEACKGNWCCRAAPCPCGPQSKMKLGNGRRGTETREKSWVWLTRAKWADVKREEGEKRQRRRRRGERWACQKCERQINKGGCQWLHLIHWVTAVFNKLPTWFCVCTSGCIVCECVPFFRTPASVIMHGCLHLCTNSCLCVRFLFHTWLLYDYVLRYRPIHT